MIAYGVPKFMNGGAMPPGGTAKEYCRARFAPVFWGFMAALTEVMGGIMIMWGFLFVRQRCFCSFDGGSHTFPGTSSRKLWANAVQPL
jgi:hypothetical protein